MNTGQDIALTGVACKQTGLSISHIKIAFFYRTGVIVFKEWPEVDDNTV